MGYTYAVPVEEVVFNGTEIRITSILAGMDTISFTYDSQLAVAEVNSISFKTNYGWMRYKLRLIECSDTYYQFRREREVNPDDDEMHMRADNKTAKGESQSTDAGGQGGNSDVKASNRWDLRNACFAR